MTEKDRFRFHLRGDRAHLLTGDTRMSREEENWLMAAPAEEISIERLKELSAAARRRFLEFQIVALSGMTRERAVRIRELRATLSWRAVAQASFKDWGPDALWHPENNQLAGMALCEAAAGLLGEDPEKPPWQSRQ